MIIMISSCSLYSFMIQDTKNENDSIYMTFSTQYNNRTLEETIFLFNFFPSFLVLFFVRTRQR